MTLDPGIHTMTDAEYFAADAMSQSSLGDWVIGKKRGKPSRSMVIGSALDALVFDGNQGYLQRFHPIDDNVSMATKKGKARIAEIKKDCGDKEILRPDEWKQVYGMLDALRDNYEASRWLKEGNDTAQVCVFAWIEGVWCKGKIDKAARKRRTLIDLKSTGYLNASQFANSIIRYRYDVQAAMYLDLWDAIDAPIVTNFVNVVVSSKFPHPSWIVEYTDEQIATGRRQYVAELRLWRKYHDTDTAAATTDGTAKCAVAV